MSQLYVGVPIGAAQYCTLLQPMALGPQTDKGITGSSIHWERLWGIPWGIP